MLVYTIQPVVQQVVKPAASCKHTFNRLSNRLFNRFDNRLCRVNDDGISVTDSVNGCCRTFEATVRLRRRAARSSSFESFECFASSNFPNTRRFDRRTCSRTESCTITPWYLSPWKNTIPDICSPDKCPYPLTLTLTLTLTHSCGGRCPGGNVRPIRHTSFFTQMHTYPRLNLLGHRALYGLLRGRCAVAHIKTHGGIVTVNH